MAPVPPAHNVINTAVNSLVYENEPRKSQLVQKYSSVSGRSRPSETLTKPRSPVRANTTGSVSLQTQIAGGRYDTADSHEEYDILETPSTQLRRLQLDGTAASSSISLPPTEDSRSQSPTDSCSSSHANMDTMTQMGLPHVIPDISTGNSSRSHTLEHWEIVGKLPQSSQDFECCKHPWNISELYVWIRDIIVDEERSMQEKIVQNRLKSLFKHFIPTMRLWEADALAEAAIASFVRQKVMSKTSKDHLEVPEDDDIEYQANSMLVSGVLTALTGCGCYSSYGHSDVTERISYRCYSFRCSRTLAQVPRTATSSYLDKMVYNLPKDIPGEELKKLTKKETIQPQLMNELASTEHNFLKNMQSMLNAFENHKLRMKDSALAKRMLENIPELLETNWDYLYVPTVARLKQSRMSCGFGDILLEWVAVSEDAYIKYATKLPEQLQIFRENKHDAAFAKFIESYERENVEGLNCVTSRLVRYPLLIKRVLDDGDPSSLERYYLERAKKKIEILATAVDNEVAFGKDRQTLDELQRQIVFPSNYANKFQKSRQVYYQGDAWVQREGQSRANRHVCIFDNYVAITATADSNYKLVVTEPPIPIDFLVLLSRDDDAVSIAKGRSTTEQNIYRESTIPQDPNGLRDRVRDLQKSDFIYFPFRIQHLGHKKGKYTIYSTSLSDRNIWCDRILMAKQNWATLMSTYRSAPFSVEVVSDIAFAYEEGKAPELPVASDGSVLERALRKVGSTEEIKIRARKQPMSLSRVNCAASFYSSNLGSSSTADSRPSNSTERPYMLVGCDFGVYFSDGTPTFWVPVLKLPKVTQIQVLPAFGLAIILSDETLMAYDLEALMAADPFSMADVGPLALRPMDWIDQWFATFSNSNTAIALTPYQISEKKRISRFSVGVLRGRTVIFGIESKSQKSVLRVFEPQAGKIHAYTEQDVKDIVEREDIRKTRLLNMRKDVNGTARIFAGMDIARETDSFFSKNRIHDITVLKKTVVLHMSNGFEVMPFPIDTRVSIADMQSTDCLQYAQNKLIEPRPLGIFRLNTNEYLLCFSTFCVYRDIHGLPSRSESFAFQGQANAVACIKSNVLAFHDNFLEIRSVVDGELKQVISCPDIRLLSKQVYNADDDATGRAGQEVIFAMAHPELKGRQLIVRMKENLDTIE
ncbi:CNH domain-containing protein [Lipomyces arxii]|uniref:CNH domain-containing protein n=1 Tax=Lipomyces arxii TaxID=56418 RepID=UPI0034CE3CEA